VRHNDVLQNSPDTLSSLGRKILRLDAATAYQRLVVHSGDGNESAKTILKSISPRDLIDGPLVSPDDAAALLSGLWLRHDWLDQSHRISQSLENPTGSFWHAIMHRREGDFSNSKYWYRRASSHPLLKTIGARASDVINPFPADKSVFRLVAQGWEELHRVPGRVVHEHLAAPYALDDGAAEVRPGLTERPGGAEMVFLRSGSPNSRYQPPLDPAASGAWQATVRAAAQRLASSVSLAQENRYCERCPVRSSCPLQPAGRQVTR